MNQKFNNNNHDNCYYRFCEKWKAHMTCVCGVRKINSIVDRLIKKLRRLSYVSARERNGIHLCGSFINTMVKKVKMINF